MDIINKNCTWMDGQDRLFGLPADFRQVMHCMYTCMMYTQYIQEIFLSFKNLIQPFHQWEVIISAISLTNNKNNNSDPEWLSCIL